MANFHDKLVLNKYILSLFGIESIGKEIIGKDGVEIFKELKLSNNEGYTEEGNTIFLTSLLNHQYPTEYLTKDMLQAYDENIVKFTKEISRKRNGIITWKYFQYLSLLFTEIFLDKYFRNKVQLLAELNEYARHYNNKQKELLSENKISKKDYFEIEPFTVQCLNKLAYWNATGSGKTLLMHINIKQYLYYANKHSSQEKNNKILLITPNEGLSKQHLKEFVLSDMNANIFSKGSPEMFSGNEVEVLEITKLSETAGDKTVAVDSFETNNLVLIDEGHGGMSGDSWKNYRDKLSETGFAFEYSATFGQAISATTGKKRDIFTQEYAKSILFDYSYKYFYEDGYGKDYRILNLKNDDEEYKELYLTANLIAFYQQQLIYKDKKSLLTDFLIEKPLWIFVGASVNAVRSEKKKPVSDVLEIVYFLKDFLKYPEKSVANIKAVIENTAGLTNANGFSIFESSFTYLEDRKLDADEIFRGINELVFNNKILGANLYLDDLKGVDGELGLRVGNSEYFGVINVGDERNLFKLAEEGDVFTSEKDFSKSLFKNINEEDSEINLLIGSKKFTEGWSSWRVSSMGLMNVGKKEGSQIIQLFGRGVRLKGYKFSLKRSKSLDVFQKPENIKEVKSYLRHLETLQIFGVNANYMEQFKKFLEEEGLPPNDSTWISIKIPTIKKDNLNTLGLKVIQIDNNKNFKKNIINLTLDSAVFQNKMIELDWYPKIDILEHRKNRDSQEKFQAVFSDKQTYFLDWTQLYFSAQNFKADKGFSNLAIHLDEIKRIVKDVTWYRLYLPKSKFEFTSFKNVFIWQEIAEALLKKYIEQFYVHFKNEFFSKNFELTDLSADDENFILEYDFLLNDEKEIDSYKGKIERLKNEVNEDDFLKINIGEGVIAFDNNYHLYKPLVFIDENMKVADYLQVIPVSLNNSEKRFLDDLVKALENKDLSNASIYVLRNQSQKGIGVFTGNSKFYPDFILWILKDGKQYIKFVDPKGIRNSKGINDPKIQFHKYIKDEIQGKITVDNIYLDSYIVSNTSFNDIGWKDNLTIDDFNKNNVYFQIEQQGKYIDEILEVL